MAEQLNRTVADVEQDNLVIPGYNTDLCHVNIFPGQGKLKRGTALAIDENAGLCAILGTPETVPSYILAKDVDATEAAVAVAYRAGHFNLNAVIVKEDYVITDFDKDKYRQRNIVFSQSL